MNSIDLYLRVREKEGRIYPDAIAARLPEVPAGHPLAAEWRARAVSSARLARRLSRPGSRRILEIGCGNGWLSHRLACLPGAQVAGVERPGSELAQARRVFPRPNLDFLAADVFSAPFPPGWFDAVVLASVIQYFPDLPELIRALLPLLRPGGELHLLDSPLYREGEVAAARRRSIAYYTALGFPQMADEYHHHAITALDEFSPRWLHKPGSAGSRLLQRLGWNSPPFPWVVIERKR